METCNIIGVSIFDYLNMQFYCMLWKVGSSSLLVISHFRNYRGISFVNSARSARKHDTAKVSFLEVPYLSFVMLTFVQFFIGAKKSGESFIDATQLRGPFCGTSSIVTYTSSYRYILVLLKRQKDLRLRQSSERGFVAGYVTYTTG